MKLNKIETALIHALFMHLHHNIDQAIDFEAIEQLNNKIREDFKASVIGEVVPGNGKIKIQSKFSNIELEY